ncbi:AAA family ATPase, partial [Arachidicoccus sp.]|uniref:AAA family ATPase n=1 Tax=Arachidicoccus sp. TaxID=1872624 RepID=UPI003D21C0AB
MKIKKIEITNFRHLNNLNFDFGSILTVIAGGNGTGKTSMLGIIGHIFKFSNLHYNLFNERFETKYSAVFRFSETHDIKGTYSYYLHFENSTNKNAALRITTENGKVRHRIDVGGRVRGGGKLS